MASSERKRVFRKARGAEEEKKLLESSIPGSTRRSTRWGFNIFKEWQMTRGNKGASLESCSFSFDCQKVQNLESINIVNMTTESLNFWLSRFIQSSQSKRRTISGQNIVWHCLWAKPLFARGK